jgi:hypothetical protein
VIATIPMQAGKVIQSSMIIERFTDAEYQKLQQTRTTAILTPEPEDMAWVKYWDEAMIAGTLPVSGTLAVALRDALITTGVLTRTRATAIFS